MRRLARLLVLLICLWATMTPAECNARKISFNLDSIAEWGKFPRFCINTYRWGDRFFNTYDSAYVVGTGMKFNVKVVTDSWFDFYDFQFDDKSYMHMRSDPSTSIGAHLTYMAVSVGYDINFSKLFGSSLPSRRRYSFGFNCSLFAAEWNYVSNDVGTRITRFGTRHDGVDMNLPFDGINVSSWNLDTYYFFNHKKYSQAAAFNFSKIQRRSQGSFYAGISIFTQNFHFDFDGLPPEMLDHMPVSWTDHKYKVTTHNYAFRVGYGFNWVPHRRWLIGVSESPVIGLKRGYINTVEKHTSASLFNRFRLGVVWNHGRWFIGGVGYMDLGLLYDREHTMANVVVSGQISAGYRFNLW